MKQLNFQAMKMDILSAEGKYCNLNKILAITYMKMDKKEFKKLRSSFEFEIHTSELLLVIISL